MSTPITSLSPPHYSASCGFGHRCALALFALGLVVILAAFLDVWRSMERVWNGSDTYGHGYVVAPLSLWLAWRMRASLAVLPVEFGWLGLPALAGCAAAWLAGEISGVNTITQLAVVGMVTGWTLLVLGHRMAWRLAFPLAFLFFMVPLGEGIEPILMQWTADATVASLRLVGLPVYREGLHFMLPSGSWSVVEACSGLRYVIAALLLALLYAHLNYRNWIRRVVFVAAAVAIALVANWVRAWMIVMIGHLSHMRLGVGADHVWYGWAFFGLVMMAVFLFGNRWREADIDVGDGGGTGRRRMAASDFRPNAAASASMPAAGQATHMRNWRAPGLVAACLVLAALFALRPVPDRLASTLPHLGYVRIVADAMGGTPRQRLSLEPVYRHALAEVRGVVDPSAAVEFYSAYYADQRTNGEMIAFGNEVLSSKDPVWAISHNSIVGVPGVENGGLQAIEYRVRSGADEALVWHWYTVAGRSLASPYGVKLATLQAILLGRGDHSSVNVVFTRLRDGEQAARERLALAANRLAAAAAHATLP